jgi:SOS response regulatory protein OraA/RecX
MEDNTRIVSIKFAAGRFFVLFSGRERGIPVSEDLVHKHRLKEGIILTAPQVAQLEREAERAECERVVVRLLGLREHSIGELRTKLARRKFDKDVIQMTVTAYIEKGLLDDAHFAMLSAQSLLARNPVGKSYLTAYLQKKQVSRDIAVQTVDLLLKESDETDLAVQSLRRRWRTYSQFEVETARSKAYTYLGRRGIGYSAAKAAFDKLLSEETKDNDR